MSKCQKWVWVQSVRTAGVQSGYSADTLKYNPVETVSAVIEFQVLERRPVSEHYASAAAFQLYWSIYLFNIVSLIL